MGRRAGTARAFAVVASVLLLGACSDDDGGGSAGSADGGSAGSGSDTVLESLSPERLCELLPNAAIERALDVTVEDAEGDQAGRPPILSMTCRYRIDFTLEEVETRPPMVTTDVKQTLDKSVEEILDDAFTDVGSDDEPVREYERVDGLGAGAGYGDEPLLGGDLETSKLVVVFTAGDERFQFGVAASPNDEIQLEQLEPLAAELLSALEAELG